MSRSYRKTPVFGNCGSVRVSEKEDKRKANRTLRHAVHQEIQTWGEAIEILPLLREVSNVWNFNHDGKSYRHNIPKERMRK